MDYDGPFGLAATSNLPPKGETCKTPAYFTRAVQNASLVEDLREEDS